MITTKCTDTKKRFSSKKLLNEKGGSGRELHPLPMHPKDDLHGNIMTFYLRSLLPIINNAYYLETCLKGPCMPPARGAHFFRKLVSAQCLCQFMRSVVVRHSPPIFNRGCF